MSLEETEKIHSGLLQITLAIADSPMYWVQRKEKPKATPQDAFDEHWFGMRSENLVKLLFRDFKKRYDAFPNALAILGCWHDMNLATRRVLCHWHTQVSDPMYRAFTGVFLPERRAAYNLRITRQRVLNWVEDQQPGRWKASTLKQWASKLMSASREAELITGKGDKQTLTLPKVPSRALEYFLYFLRETQFKGSLTQNPYFASVGLDDRSLDPIIKELKSINLNRQGNLVDFQWKFPSLKEWGEASL